MNKGVELLLARRETHPDEFDPTKNWIGRWERILHFNGVMLNDPDTYPTGKKGEKFTADVMRRLLEGDDNSTKYTAALAKSMISAKDKMAAHILQRVYSDE